MLPSSLSHFCLICLTLFMILTFLPSGCSLWLVRATCPCYKRFFFLHRLSANLPSCRARSMECNATSGLRLWIWTTMHPNFFMNFWRDSLSACHKLASVADVMRWDQLVSYCTLKHSTRVLKLSKNHGGSPPYQVNVAPLKDVGKTRHKIACHWCTNLPE